jgi:hypothetical protein
MSNEWNSDLGMSHEDAKEFYAAYKIQDENTPEAKAKKFEKHQQEKKEAKRKQFPIELMPEPIQEIAKHFAEYRGYPLDFVLTSILTAVGSSVGNSQTIKSPNGYTNKAVLWMLIVASPGINKTSPLFWAYNLLNKRQSEDTKRAKDEKKALQVLAKEDGRKIDKDEYVDVLKWIISDVTPEALVNQLSNNSKGCTGLIDEIAGLIQTFGRYNKGNDKELYLSIWQGTQIIRDTLTHGTQTAANPFLSIIGTIQPDVLSKVFVEDNDGFFDRWLICYPDRLTKPYPSSTDVNPVIAAKHERFMSLLTELYFQEEGNQLSYTAEAWQVVYKWICEGTDKENNPDTSDRERGIRAKMQIYVHRFALIMQLMEYGCAGIHDDRVEVRVKAANAAVALADYFFAMAEKARLKDASELITGQLKELYDLIPDDQEFKKVQFLEYSDFLKIPERTANSILKHNLGKLWIKVKHGVYAKN